MPRRLCAGSEARRGSAAVCVLAARSVRPSSIGMRNKKAACAAAGLRRAFLMQPPLQRASTAKPPPSLISVSKPGGRPTVRGVGSDAKSLTDTSDTFFRAVAAAL